MKFTAEDVKDLEKKLHGLVDEGYRVSLEIKMNIQPEELLPYEERHNMVLKEHGRHLSILLKKVHETDDEEKEEDHDRVTYFAGLLKSTLRREMYEAGEMDLRIYQHEEDANQSAWVIQQSMTDYYDYRFFFEPTTAFTV